jgi:hypothetical protein
LRRFFGVSAGIEAGLDFRAQRVRRFRDSALASPLTEKRRFVAKCWLGALLVAVACGVSRVAGANGRFPEANQVVFAPGDVSHLLVRTTFGLLESRDAGQSFSWTCEDALGLSGESDPMLTLTASGARVAATYAGIRSSADGCAYRAPPELDRRIVLDLALDASQPTRVLAFRTESLGPGLFDSALVRSDDEGQTWVALEPPLPSDILPLSLDIAPSDSSRIYLSGRLGLASEYISVLLRSDDGGKSFERFQIPGTAQQKLAFIAAVDPIDADHVFLRVDDPEGTLVLSSSDAGQSFREIMRGHARLPGFAIARDASEIALGGPNDGLWVAAADGSGLEQRSGVSPSCLGYGADGLYACSDATQLGTLLSRSRDGGRNFEILLTFDSLCGVTACEPTSEVARSCRAVWETIAPTLGTTCGTAPVEKPPITPPSSLRASGACALGRFGVAGEAAGKNADRVGVWISFALLSIRRRARRRL